ncbi:unnamed protein product, partial [Iphiclides podalirius]
MCGDHPSVTKTELNAREPRQPDKVKVSAPLSHHRVTPSRSRAECPQEAPPPSFAAPAPPSAPSAPLPQRADPLPASRALMQAALGSFRWPPYLVGAWAALLLAAHALHALLAALDAALPPLGKLCHYFRTWTEESWRAQEELGRKVVPLALGGATVALYTLYGALYAVHAVTLWAIEPLCGDLEDQPSAVEVPKVTDYLEEGPSKTNFGLKY